jgi:hypothetical protein
MASIAVCNIALAEIRAEAITAIDDGSPEADACAQHYDDCYNTLVEAHEWGFAKKRVVLALLSVNDRPTEWLYAYQAPADLGVMGAVVYPFQAPLAGVYYAWPYNYPRPSQYFVDFVYDGATIYTNLENASLEYSSNDIDESVWPAMFRRALALDLASKLAITLLDNRAMKGDLIQQAEVAKRRAMADDFNRYPRHDERIVDEVAWARS